MTPAFHFRFETFLSAAVTEKDFEKILAIYQNSIVASERKSTGDMTKLLKRGDYTFFVARENDGEILCFAIVYCPPELDFALLEYMATRADRRGSGIGGKLFNYLTSELGTRSILMEIDSPEEAGSDQTMRQRRRDFYERHGARQVAGLNYMLPLEANAGPPPAMVILLWSKANKSDIERDRLEEWLTDIYVNVYNKARTDPRIKAMFHGSRDRFQLVSHR